MTAVRTVDHQPDVSFVNKSVLIDPPEVQPENPRLPPELLIELVLPEVPNSKVRRGVRRPGPNFWILPQSGLQDHVNLN